VSFGLKSHLCCSFRCVSSPVFLYQRAFELLVPVRPLNWLERRECPYEEKLGPRSLISIPPPQPG
jgi:hypothetical protein